MDMLDKQDIEEAMRDKGLWTYTPVCRPDIKIGIAVANEAGFTPVPYNMTRDCGETYKEISAYCDALNLERGQDKRASLDIVCSSMRKGKVKK